MSSCVITEGGVEEGRSSRLLQWSSMDHMTPPEGVNGQWDLPSGGQQNCP